MTFSSRSALPIGIFDSGVGGLTVLKALRRALPEETFLYLGDTARLPYGTKSPDTVRAYALSANEILVERGIKLLVVACNTATAVALPALQQKFAPLPVIGVISAGAKAALTLPTQDPVIVLATESTVKWHAYQAHLAQLAPGRAIIEWPCQLLVALAEEGWCQGALVEQIIQRVLAPLFDRLKQAQITPGCFLLGCTHFPVLRVAMQSALGEQTLIVDPAEAVAEEVKALLVSQGLHSAHRSGAVYFMATDGVERFARVAEIFLGEPIAPGQVEWVNLGGALPETALKSA